MSSISIKGVAVGALFGIIVGFILGFAILIGFAASAGLNDPAEFEQILDSNGLALLNVAVGSAVSIAGGYLAARVAGRGEMLNGALSGLVCIIVGLGLTYAMAPIGWGIVDIAEYVSVPLFGLLGGYLRKRQTAVA